MHSKKEVVINHSVAINFVPTIQVNTYKLHTFIIISYILRTKSVECLQSND